MRFTRKPTGTWTTYAATLHNYNIIIMLMIMKSEDLKRKKSGAEISTNELRLEFDRVLKALKQGRSLTLTYRNKPVARIVPIEEERILREDDPIYSLLQYGLPTVTRPSFCAIVHVL